jgi:hypothetical protein
VPHLGALSTWQDVLVVTLVLMPALFSASLLVLPLIGDRRLLSVVAVIALVLAVVLSLLDAQIAANLAKFAALTAVGWLFLSLFEALSWVVAVALIIPWVDAYSVWRGPTRSITTNHPAVFTKLSIGLVVPGGGAWRLGLPDVMFFALFLAASARFGLRPRATWLAMTTALGLTLALTTVWKTNGLPALPAISLGFLLVNADLIWRQLGRRPQAPASASGG